MIPLIPYHLRLVGALHIGVHSSDPASSADYIPSDTLFAALTNALRLGGGDTQAWSEAFGDDPPLLLTSAFPRAGQVRFLPLPAHSVGLFSVGTRRERGKALKHLRYFSETLWRRWLSGETLDGLLFPGDESLEPASDEGIALQDGAFWLSPGEMQALPDAWRKPAIRGRRALRRQRVWASERTPRVRVGRTNSASTLFHIGRITFAPDCGLWFGVQWRDPNRPIGPLSARAAFERALAILQDHGLGGERSVGYGGFQALPMAALDLPAPRPGSPAYLLSRYHPAAAEIQQGALGRPAAYSVTRVGGFLHTPDAPAQLRRSLRLVEAGSLIVWPAGSGGAAGDLVDVRPRYPGQPAPFPHPVWRYGYAAAAGLSSNEATHG